jgi:hypothetical protein
MLSILFMNAVKLGYNEIGDSEHSLGQNEQKYLFSWFKLAVLKLGAIQIIRDTFPTLLPSVWHFSIFDD